MSSLTKSSESVARVLHTLVGNFNNLGFQDIGESLVKLETNSRLDSAQKEDFRNYVKNLHKLADVISKSREEIQSAGQVGAETKEEMANLVKQFQELQRSLVRNAVPLETSELAAEEAALTI